MHPSSILPDCNNSPYTSCYCEENVYLLVKRFLTSPGISQKWDVFTVFISNPTRTVALWNQRAASSRYSAVIWDYHVVLVVRDRSHLVDQSLSCYQTRKQGTWIYDLDTHLPVPCYWKEYLEQTFPLGADVPVRYRSLFRVVPGEEYLDNFASDRSHMVSLPTESQEVRYLANPPPWPLICGPLAAEQGVKHNLMTHFVSMDENGKRFGSLMDFDCFVSWCALPERGS
ncbi:hypothetical protein HYDPIDRAFT_122833 [Hydnomerulius pinastri MD-312]|nr:hypothetical protein HYDPIDRAFT_122833 [Hydnomerulius pinastri MD-312]